MGKFTGTQVGANQDVGGQLELPIEEIATRVRPDGVSEAPAEAPTIPQESTPVTRSLEEQGLIEPAPEPTVVTQTDQTRQPSISESRPDIAYNEPQIGFDFNGEGLFVQRANKVRSLLDQSSSRRIRATPKVDDVGTYQEGNVEALEALPLAAQKVLFSPNVLGAGQETTIEGFDGQPRQSLNVDPALADVFVGVMDRLFAGEPVGEQQFGQLQTAEEAEATIGEDGNIIEGSRKAAGNAAVGREIAQQYHREQAAQQGMSQEEYQATAPNPTQEEATVLGALAKEVYALSNPDIVKRIDGKKSASGQVEYQLTAKGGQQLRAWQKHAYQPFVTPEIAPSATPTPNGTLQQDAPVRSRTGVIDPAKQKIDENLRESQRNQNFMPKVVGVTTEKIVYTLAPGALQEISGYEGKFNTDVELEQAVRGGTAPATPMADMFEVGVNRLKKIYGKRDLLEYDLAKAEADYKDSPDPETAARLETARQALDGYDPLTLWKQEQNKTLETFNTIARYRGKANHLTWSIQSGTLRQNVQQTRLNPGANKVVRFALGDGQLAPISVISNPQITRNWKEVITTKLLAEPLAQDHSWVRQLKSRGIKPGGKYLTPKARVAFFDQMEQTGALAEFGKIGEVFEKLLPSNNQAAVYAERYKAVQINDRNQLSVPQELGQDQGNFGDLSEQETALVQEFLGRHGDIEGLYAVEAAIEVAKYLRGENFHSAMEAEMDGITNGPSNLGIMLGIRDIAFRSGAMTDSPIFKLFPKDVGQKEFLEMTENEQLDLTNSTIRKAGVQGDVRDVIADYMEVFGDDLVDSWVMDSNIKYSEEQSQAFRDILTVAKGNKPLRKTPPMTLVYGQDIQNLDQHIEKFFFVEGKESDTVQKLAADADLGSQEVIDFLHKGVIVPSIYHALEPDVIEATGRLKAVSLAALFTNRLPHYTAPSGTEVYVGAKGPAGLDRKVPLSFEDSTKGTKFEPGVSLYREEARADTLRGKRRGGYTSGRLVPFPIQGFDAATVIGLTSGKNFSDGQREARARGLDYNFTQIFDAFKTNVGNLDIVRKQANKAWKQALKDNDPIDKIMGRENGWLRNNLNEWAADVKNDPDKQINLVSDRGVVPDNRLLAELFGPESQTVPEGKKSTNQFRAILNIVEGAKDYTDEDILAKKHFEDTAKIMKDFNKRSSIDLYSDNSSMPEKDVLLFFRIFDAHTGYLDTLHSFADKVARNREKLHKELAKRQDEILQFDVE